MNSARLSRFPHLSWFAFPVSGNPNGAPVVVSMQSVCHAISMTLSGNHTVRWITHGRETRWPEQPKTLHLFPADGDDHTFITNPPPEFRQAAVFIPESHLALFAESEGVRPPQSLRRRVLAEDHVLNTCVPALGASTRKDDARLDARNDEIARRFVLRLCELNGMGPPEWHDDASVFERRQISTLVEFIDGHLAIAPSVSEMAALMGMSGSHFAKKFRQSTGLSLHRFVNLRRVKRALTLLKTKSHSVDSVSRELGFSSQSHFTHVFSGLTGMTPAKYQKQFRRTVG